MHKAAILSVDCRTRTQIYQLNHRHNANLCVVSFYNKPCNVWLKLSKHWFLKDMRWKWYDTACALYASTISEYKKRTKHIPMCMFSPTFVRHTNGVHSHVSAHVVMPSELIHMLKRISWRLNYHHIRTGGDDRIFYEKHSSLYRND